MRKIRSQITFKILAAAAGLAILAASCGSDSPSGDPGISGTADPGGADQPAESADGNGNDSGAATGSGGNGADPGGEVVDLDPDDVTLTAGLVRFDDCDTLLDHLRTEYGARVGPWGFNEGGWFGPMPLREGPADMEMMEEAAMADDAGVAAPTATTASTLVEGVDFSGTNVQEAGVDEADIVKTDGSRIFTLSQGRLTVVDAASRSAVGSVAVAEGWGRELFIDGDSLLLITRSHGYSPEGSRGSQTVLQRIDVSGDTPEIVETVHVEGDYLSARSVGGTARVILRYDPHWKFPFVFPQNEDAYDVAEAANRTAVLNSTLDDWLPHYAFGSADRLTESLLVPCSAVHAPSVFSGFGVTAVLSMPIGGGFEPSQSTAVMAPGDTVYASTESLYAATTRWIDSDEFDGDEDVWRRAWSERRTSIHRFDITGEAAAYASSGEVLGVIRNQFALSEHNGYLRIVTTVGDPWGEESESWVRVLSTDGDVLTEVGSVGDIGRGEQVQSVRFAGDIGYVVTFRQIDPFYTIDLSDPTSPEILGELKIPGFSSYLHPISDTMVLGVGSDADASGRVTGAKVSLFDVSDLASPREVAVWTAPDGWNDIGWDHRAFLWWAPEDLAIIPVTVWDEWSGAVVLRVADGTITEVGRVDHDVEGEAPGQTDCRRLTVSDLPTADWNDFSTELEYAISESYNAVLACDPDEAGMTGFECLIDPWMDMFTDEGQGLGLLRSNESISICWPNEGPNVIVRSIVIGDDLWTLGFKGWGHFDGASEANLHVHDLRSLVRLAVVDL